MEIKALSPGMSSSYLDAIATLRVRVWSHQLKEKAFVENKWWDKHDLHAFHWIVLNENSELVASARLSTHNTVVELPDFEEIKALLTELPSPIAMMSRLVVSPEYQRRGIAQKLDVARLQKATQINAQSIVLQVPAYRRKAIEELGFKCIGKAKEETFHGTSNIDFFLYAKVHSLD
ncbi:MAG: GNAT family N-acetyltransferase [Cyanobacteria bacterium P01_C01_bin.89]